MSSSRRTSSSYVIIHICISKQFFALNYTLAQIVFCQKKCTFPEILSLHSITFGETSKVLGKLRKYQVTPQLIIYFVRKLYFELKIRAIQKINLKKKSELLIIKIPRKSLSSRPDFGKNPGIFEQEQNLKNSGRMIGKLRIWTRITKFSIDFGDIFVILCNRLDVKMNRTSSVPKSVPRYKLDNDQY